MVSNSISKFAGKRSNYRTGLGSLLNPLREHGCRSVDGESGGILFGFGLSRSLGLGFLADEGRG